MYTVILILAPNTIQMIFIEQNYHLNLTPLNSVWHGWLMRYLRIVFIFAHFTKAVHVREGAGVHKNNMIFLMSLEKRLLQHKKQSSALYSLYILM